MTKEIKPKRRKIILRILLVLLVLGLVAGYFGYDFYKKIFGSNVDLGGKETAWLYIEPGDEWSDISSRLEDAGYIKSMGTLRWVAERKNLAKHIYRGRYKLSNGMSTNGLVDMLRSGNHVPVNVTFNRSRTPQELAGKATKNIFADSISLLTLLKDINVRTAYGFGDYTYMCMYVPNTYEFNWATTAQDFVERMDKEYQRFWNRSRKARAEKIGLKPVEVVTLASIVQSETNKHKDRPTIAGVYMNRLEQGIPLEADPTLVFALGDFSIRRVLNKHKKIESPYNTYKNKGLPPGPIALPSVPYIEAVLDYEKHDYIFFCAKEDFSGYSNFAKNYSQHLKNARKYQAALNKRKIYR